MERWPLFVAVVVAAVAAFTDWRKGTIPNWLTLGSIALAPVVHVAVFYASHRTFVKEAWMEGGMSVAGILACGLVPYLLFMKNAAGAGDVKLFAALGAILQFTRGMEAELYSFMAACLIAPAFLAYEGKLLRTVRNAAILLINPLLPKARRREVVPELMTYFRMGPAILIGTILALIADWRMAH